MRENLTRAERLTSKADIARVFDKPDVKTGCRGAKLVARRNDLEYSRFAPTLVRKYGNAVERNYARRVLKEIFRKNKDVVPKGYDIIIILYPGDFRYREREQQFTSLFRRFGFVEANP